MALLSKNTDIVFIIDKSGSMSKYISKVVATLSNFADSLKAENVTYRLGLVEYEGSEKTFAHQFTNSASSDTTYFTTDVEAFKNELRTISDTGWREDGMYAIQTALNLDFSEGADKRFILLTDENYYDGQSVDLSTIESALATNGVILDVVGTEGSCRTAWEPVANRTHGKFYSINGSTTTEQMVDILNKITTNIVYGDNNVMHVGRHWSYSFGTATVAGSANLASSEDLINGGETSYYYGRGSQITYNADKNDTVNLFGVSLDQITSAEISAGAVKIGFNDGGNLTMLGQSNSQFILNGSMWTAYQSTQTWIKTS